MDHIIKIEDLGEYIEHEIATYIGTANGICKKLFVRIYVEPQKVLFIVKNLDGQTHVAGNIDRAIEIYNGMGV